MKNQDEEMEYNLLCKVNPCVTGKLVYKLGSILGGTHYCIVGSTDSNHMKNRLSQTPRNQDSVLP